MFVFRKTWRALLSCYLRFEIRPFALLPTNFSYPIRARRQSLLPIMSEFEQMYQNVYVKVNKSSLFYLNFHSSKKTRVFTQKSSLFSVNMDRMFIRCYRLMSLFNGAPLKTWIQLVNEEAAIQRCSVRKGVLRNLTKFKGKHLCQSLFFNKGIAFLMASFWYLYC